MERVELHAHTKMSAMDGLITPADLVRHAAELGHKAVAITDHGAVQAFPEAYQAGKAHGIKIIYGLELMVESEDVFTVLLIAKNARGLKNLYALVSLSHTAYFDELTKEPRIPQRVLSAHREGLLLGSAGVDGECERAAVAGYTEEELASVADYYDFVGIRPLDDLKKIHAKIVSACESIGKPVVALGNVQVLRPEDAILQAVLRRGMRESYTKKQPPLHLMTTDEMLAVLSYLGEEKAFEVVVANTNRIADMVEEIPPISEGLFLPQLDNAEEELVRCCNFRLQILNTCNRHVDASGNREPSDAAKSRLDAELDSIIRNGYAAVYMIARRLVMEALGDDRCVSTRGSIGSSFVAYLLGITDVDPLEYDIPFEAFAGLDGSKPPDISLLFDREYQAVMH